MNIPPINPSETPSFDFPTPQRPRYAAGWVAIVVMLGLMFSLQLAQYLDRGKPTTAKSYVDQITQMRLAYDFRAMPMLQSSSVDPTKETLDTVLRKVEPEAATQIVAARIVAAIRTEQKQPVSPAILAKLKSSTKPGDAARYEIYSNEKLTTAKAEALQKQLDQRSFLDKMATRQAWAKAGEPNRIQIADPNRAGIKMGAGVVFALVFLAGLITLIIGVIAKIANLLPSKGFAVGPLDEPGADRLAARCAQLIAIFLSVQIGASLILSLLRVEKNVATIAMTASVMVAFIFVSRMPVAGEMFSLERLGFRRGPYGRYALWGIGAAIANLPLLLAVSMLSQRLFAGLPQAEHPTTTMLLSGTNWLGILSALFAASIAAPFLEELMFRATLLPALAATWGKPLLAILAQGLIFAIIHPTGIPAWLPLATIGAMSGFLARQTNSIVPSMIMHATHNLGTLLFALTIAS